MMICRQIVGVFSFLVFCLPGFCGEYIVPRDQTDQLPESERIIVLEELGLGYASTFPSNLSNDGFYDALVNLKPKTYNPDNIGPLFVQKIAKLKGWLGAIKTFERNKLVLMSRDAFRLFVENAHECADRIHNTPAYRYAGKDNLEELLHLAGLKRGTGFKSWGLQRVSEDPVAFFGAAFSISLLPLALTLWESYNLDQRLYQSLKNRMDTVIASCGTSRGVSALANCTPVATEISALANCTPVATEVSALANCTPVATKVSALANCTPLATEVSALANCTSLATQISARLDDSRKTLKESMMALIERTPMSMAVKACAPLLWFLHLKNTL
ncbi:MAG TPA: hypothetical protein VEL47_07085 [Myxococcota bacterium]|nr:hypothetical protein [Myxococcota bacterium]